MMKTQQHSFIMFKMCCSLSFWNFHNCYILPRQTERNKSYQFINHNLPIWTWNVEEVWSESIDKVVCVLTSNLAPEVDLALVDIRWKLHAGEVNSATLLEIDGDTVNLDIFQIAW